MVDHWTSTVDAASRAERLRAQSECDYLDERPDASEVEERSQRREQAPVRRVLGVLHDPWANDGRCTCRLPGCPSLGEQGGLHPAPNVIQWST